MDERKPQQRYAPKYDEDDSTGTILGSPLSLGSDLDQLEQELKSAPASKATQLSLIRNLRALQENNTQRFHTSELYHQRDKRCAELEIELAHYKEMIPKIRSAEILPRILSPLGGVVFGIGLSLFQNEKVQDVTYLPFLLGVLGIVMIVLPWFVGPTFDVSNEEKGDA